MADISAISSGVQTLTSALSTVGSIGGLAIVTPNNVVGYQPMAADGRSAAGNALVFHIEDENTVSLESDIPDHYVADNTAKNDTIALRPETITVHGYIGELTDVLPSTIGGVYTGASSNIQALATAVQSKLGTLSAYAPSVVNAAIQAYNDAFYAAQVATAAANSSVAAARTIQGKVGGVVIGNTTDASGIAQNQKTALQNAQQTIFQQFYGYWHSRTLFTVQTPWAIFQNCAILRMRSVQGGDTNQMSGFEITFKPIRYVSSATVAITTNTLDGRAANQAAPEVDTGYQAQGTASKYDPTRLP